MGGDVRAGDGRAGELPACLVDRARVPMERDRCPGAMCTGGKYRGWEAFRICGRPSARVIESVGGD